MEAITKLNMCIIMFAGWNWRYIRSDQFHVVSPGPCLHEGDSFCTRRVANSVCSTEKNECFCKPGYVSIQESYGITCKTLLTNLKCQVDADCIHILNSACHPGAGLCACPSGTLYVAQDHTCQLMAEHESNMFCDKCRQVNGICYRRENTVQKLNMSSTVHLPGDLLNILRDTHQSILDSLFRYSFGCQCPYNTAMPLGIPKNHWIIHETNETTVFDDRRNDRVNLAELPQWSFCKAIFVNIGEYCNNVDVLCRAKYAQCVQDEDRARRQENPFGSICSCAPGYIPVYQNHLGYYECFQQIAKNQSECSDCIKTGGKCFTMNSQSATAIGCTCPQDRAPASTVSSTGNIQTHDRPAFSSSDGGADSCAENLVDVSCFRNHLEVCYRPPTHPPYNKLSENLANHKAVAFVTDAQPNAFYDVDCHLSLTQKHRARFTEQPSPHAENVTTFDGLSWCLSLDWREQPMHPPCFLRITEYMSGHLYSGYLAIVSDTEYNSPIHNLLFHFTCKTNNEIPQRVPGQVFERAWLGAYHETLPWSEQDITIDLVNQTGQPLETAFEFTPIRLRVQLQDRKAKYHALQVEACYTSRWPVDDQDIVDSQEYPLLIKGCPIRNMERGTTSTKTAQGAQPSALAGLLESPTRFETELFRVSHDAASQVFCFSTEECLKHSSTGHPYHNDLRGQTERFFHSWATNSAEDEAAGDRLVIESSKSQTLGNSKPAVKRPVEYTVHRLRFRCVIRLCTEHAWCGWPVGCGSRVGSALTPRTTFQPPILEFVTRTAQLNVLRLIATTHEPAQTKADLCTTFFCTTGLHSLLLIGLVGLLTCVMGVVGLMLARRYQRRYDSETFDHPNHQIAKPARQSYRRSDVALPTPDVFTAQNKQYLPTQLAEMTDCALVEQPTDTNLWFTLHTYSNSQLDKTFKHASPRYGNHTFLTIPRCSCAESGTNSRMVSVNQNLLPQISTHYPTLNPVNLTSFQSDHTEFNPEVGSHFATLSAPCDSTSLSSKGATYLQLTERDRLSSPSSLPSESNWTPYPGHGLLDGDSPTRAKNYSCLVSRSALHGETTSSIAARSVHE